jgi:hypothetical protein
MAMELRETIRNKKMKANWSNVKWSIYLLSVTSEKNVASNNVKKPSLNYEALSRHGYASGLSILHVPTSQGQANEQDWS